MHVIGEPADDRQAYVRGKLQDHAVRPRGGTAAGDRSPAAGCGTAVSGGSAASGAVTAAGDGAPVAGGGTTAGADGVILQLPAGVGLAVITGLADNVRISPAGDGTSVAMSWKRRSATA